MSPDIFLSISLNNLELITTLPGCSHLISITLVIPKSRLYANIFKQEFSAIKLIPSNTGIVDFVATARERFVTASLII